MPVVQDAAHSPTGPPRRGPLRAPPLRGRPHPANDEPAARVNASRPPVAPDLLRLIPCPMGQGLLVIEHRAEIEDVEIPATAKIKLGHLRIWPPKANIALAGQRRSATMAATACCFCGRTVDQVTHLIQGPENRKPVPSNCGSCGRFSGVISANLWVSFIRGPRNETAPAYSIKHEILDQKVSGGEHAEEDGGRNSEFLRPPRQPDRGHRIGSR
jgi:hypothetical protein